MRKIFVSVLVFCLFLNCVYSEGLEDVDNANPYELEQETLFVSLGSYCETAAVLRGCNIRKAAFPFDWITSIDSEKFLEVLEQDFKFFLDENYLMVGDIAGGPLINTRYHLEFLHDGDFRGVSYSSNMEMLRLKYQRRVERFRKLAKHQGKIFFLRTAYPDSITDPYRYYHCADNLEISDEYAWRLYSVLQNKFPNVDFTLIIMNTCDGKDIYEEKRLSPRIIKIRSNSSIDINKKREFFERLIPKESKKQEAR